MLTAHRTLLPIPSVRSLTWDGDALVGWLGGQRRITLGNKVQWLAGRPTVFPHPVDALISSPDGECQVQYERLGTKALLLKHGRLLRELNRSSYRATDYEYPMALSPRVDGQVLLAHCPTRYNELRLEDAETGKHLTAGERQKLDVFQSRLQFSRDARYLLSAGWAWTPADLLMVYDVPRAMEGQGHLDTLEAVRVLSPKVEITSACFLDSDHLALTTAMDGEESPSVPVLGGLLPARLGFYSLTSRGLLSQVPIRELLGSLLPFGPSLVSLYGQLKLVNPHSGEVLISWPDLPTGRQTSSLLGGHPGPLPIVAVDAANRRFAAARPEDVVVTHLNG